MTEFAPYTYPAAAVPNSAARPLRTRGTVAIAALVVAMVSAAVTAGLSTFARSMTEDAKVRGEWLANEQALVAGAAVLTAMITIGALLFAGIAFICWLHRARTNVDAFGGSWMKWGPGWSAGSWFVPIGNLVIPLLVVSEIDRATDSHVGGLNLRRPGRVVVVLWATLWTVILIVDRVATFAAFAAAGSSGAFGAAGASGAFGAAGASGAFGVTVLSAVVEIAAASAAIGVVRRITAGQEAVMSGAVFPGQAMRYGAVAAGPAAATAR